MTFEVPTAEVLPDNQKGQLISTEESEPTLNIQIEQPNDAPNGEDLMPSSEDKPVNKKKGIFINPFHKSTKKDTDEASTALVNATVETPEANDHKVHKGFGNFLSRVKNTTSSNNNMDLSEPTTTTVLVEEENEDVHENVADLETPAAAEHTKLQSLLSKFFGNNSHKKETCAGTADQEVTKAEHHVVDEVVTTVSPPLNRRVTSFFSKKYFGSDRKHKSSEKDEKHGGVIVQDAHQTPIIVFNDDTTTTNNNAYKGVVA